VVDWGGHHCRDPAELAQVFLTSKIPQGLSARQSSPDAWTNFFNSVVGMGAAQGIDANELKARLSWFKDAVYQQWDSWIFSSILPKVNQAKGQFTPNVAGDYVGIGMSHAGEIDPNAFPTFDSGLLPVYQPGHDACANAMANAGAQAVSIWLAEGRPGLPAPPAKAIPAPPNPNTACVAFDNQLKALLTAALGSSVKDNVGKYCQYHGAPEYVYICPKSSNATAKCKAAMTLLGDSTQCIEYSSGSPIIPFVCPPKNLGGQTYVVDAPVNNPPKGCHAAQMNNPPPNPGGGINNRY